MKNLTSLTDLDELAICISKLESHQFSELEEYALEMMKCSNFAGAEMIYKVLVKNSFINEYILNNLAVIYGKKGRIDQKINLLNASIKINSSGSR